MDGTVALAFARRARRRSADIPTRTGRRAVEMAFGDREPRPLPGRRPRQFVRSRGGTLTHVKPHGALYHGGRFPDVARDRRRRASVRTSLVLVEPPGLHADRGRDAFFPVAEEAFADGAIARRLARFARAARRGHHRSSRPERRSGWRGIAPWSRRMGPRSRSRGHDLRHGDTPGTSRSRGGSASLHRDGPPGAARQRSFRRADGEIDHRGGARRGRDGCGRPGRRGWADRIAETAAGRPSRVQIFREAARRRSAARGAAGMAVAVSRSARFTSSGPSSRPSWRSSSTACRWVSRRSCCAALAALFAWRAAKVQNRCGRASSRSRATSCAATPGAARIAVDGAEEDDEDEADATTGANGRGRRGRGRGLRRGSAGSS